jgi:hypothetical protein
VAFAPHAADFGFLAAHSSLLAEGAFCVVHEQYKLIARVTKDVDPIYIQSFLFTMPNATTSNSIGFSMSPLCLLCDRGGSGRIFNHLSWTRGHGLLGRWRLHRSKARSAVRDTLQRWPETSVKSSIAQGTWLSTTFSRRPPKNSRKRIQAQPRCTLRTMPGTWSTAA